MSKAVATCKPADSIEAAEHTMTAHRVRRLPVVDAQNRLVGILSLNDIAREAARERSRVGREVTDAEVGETLSVVCEPHRSRS
jgi:CBS domain-containing protein